MISKLKILTLQKGIAKQFIKMLFGHKQTQQHNKILARAGTSRTAVWSVTSWPPNNLNDSYKVKLFKCFNKGRIINKQSQIWQFLMLTGVEFTA